MPRGIAVKPVDYKGGELSNLISSEFSSHHRYGLYNKGRTSVPALSFVSDKQTSDKQTSRQVYSDEQISDKNTSNE